MVEIVTYSDNCLEGVIDLILEIQKEFAIPVTLEEQPDLINIPATYQSAKGNFWVADCRNKVVGTIGLMDIGGGIGVIRKMFVDAPFRGRNVGVSHSLLQTLLAWGKSNEFEVVYLGTVEQLVAAHRFYEKNGFERIKQDNLPGRFPMMKVDTRFYKYEFKKATIMATNFNYVTHLDVKFPHLERIDVNEMAKECKDKWFNQTLTEVNESVVRIGIVEGEYHWHKHDNDDEFFFVLEGQLLIDLEDKTIELNPNQGVTISKGIRHRPRALKRTVMLMMETKSIKPTGD